MRVVVADDQTEVRLALRLLLESQQMRVVGEAAGMKELFTQVWGQLPDLLLLDWELPHSLSQQELISSLRLLSPHMRVVALSSHMEARQPALKAGADLFISKGSPPNKLIRALQSCTAARA